jgi:hypothetical protein
MLVVLVWGLVIGGVCAAISIGGDILMNTKTGGKIMAKLTGGHDYED